MGTNKLRENDPAKLPIQWSQLDGVIALTAEAGFDFENLDAVDGPQFIYDTLGQEGEVWDVSDGVVRAQGAVTHTTLSPAGRNNCRGEEWRRGKPKASDPL